MDAATLAKILPYWRGIIISLAIIYVLKYFFDKRRIYVLGNKLPGPKCWPILGNAIEFMANDLDVLDKLYNYNKEYGLVRLWLGPMLNVFICTAEDAEVYYTSPALYDRSEHFKFLEPIIGQGLITANGPVWKKARKLMEPSFSYSSLRDFGPIFQEKTDILIGLLEKQVGKPVFSIHEYMKHCNFDIIMRTMCDIESNAQTQIVETLQHIDFILANITTRMHSVWQQVELLYRFSEIGKDFFRRVSSVNKYLDGVIAVHRKTAEKSKLVQTGKDEEEDFKKRSFALRLIEQEEWDDSEIRHHLATMIAGGFETSTNASSFILVLLGIHQDVQERLYQEILSARGDLSDRQLEKLEYLNQVIKETLRIFPIGPIIFRKADEDVQFGKHLIPKGTAIGINIFAIHRNPKYYENPDSFNPENFSKENVANRHPYAFVPFGMGIRKCIGEKFAWMVLRIIITKILLNYKIECDLKLEDIKVRVGITLKMENKWPIRLLRRQKPEK